MQSLQAYLRVALLDYACCCTYMFDVVSSEVQVPSAAQDELAPPALHVLSVWPLPILLGFIRAQFKLLSFSTEPAPLPARA